MFTPKHLKMHPNPAVGELFILGRAYSSTLNYALAMIMNIENEIATAISNVLYPDNDSVTN